jgi:steroid 5-alpha reductase family enzyme
LTINNIRLEKSIEIFIYFSKFRTEQKLKRDEKRALLTLPIIILFGVGLAIAGSQSGATFAGIPVFAIGVALAFILNWIAFIPAYLRQTEKFFDLMGGFTFISVSILTVAASPVVDGRSWLLLGMVIVWALRLSSFLYKRIRGAGEDRRFRGLKPSFPRFLLTWTLQGAWVSFSLAAALAAITSETRLDLGLFALIGFLVWAFGFVFEIIADSQKTKFNRDPANKGKFINSGVWSWSRHPNYFGEIVLWIGIALVALPILRGWQWITMISPFFITVLLTRVSGIPMLEKRADQKWGGQEDYEAYKSHTSILIPLPPKN